MDLCVVFLLISVLGAAVAENRVDRGGVFDRSDPDFIAFQKAAKGGKFRFGTPDGNLDLGTITTEWGNAWCQNGGTSLADASTGPWSTNSNPHCGCRVGENTWCSYQDYGYPCIGFDSEFKDVEYGQPGAAPATPFIFEQWFDNDSNGTEQSTFTHTESIENIYSATMTKSVSATWSMSITAGIPDICQVNDQFSINISVTESQTQTTTHSRSWSVSEDIQIPPMSTIHAVMEVTKTTFTVPFQAFVHFAGMAATWCNDRVQGHWLWFPEAQDLFSVGQFPCTANSDGSADCVLNGTFVGVQGVSVHVNVTQCPLNTRCGPRLPRK